MSKWEDWKKAVGETRPWDLVNPSVEQVSNEVQTARYDICLSCPELIKLTKQCKKCGCFMNLKTKLKMAECPIGKWGVNA